MTKRITPEEYIRKVTERYGDRYDLSKTLYVNRRTKVTIVCRVHGDFEILPLSFLSNKHGCSKCGVVSGSRLSTSNTTKPKSSFKIFSRRAAKLSSDVLLSQLREMHGTRYVYENDLSYTNKDTGKLTILCKEHGEFTQSIKNHLQGQGCPKCGLAAAGNKLRGTKKSFIKKATKVHQSKFTYTDIIYKSSTTKLDILCNTCCKTFSMSPNAHLSGQGCPYCRGMYKTISDIAYLAKGLEGIIVHPGPIQNSTTPVKFTCKEHGTQTRAVKDLSLGRWCYGCTKGGFRANRPGILYYVSVDHGTAYKIGVTNTSVEQRFKGLTTAITTLRTWYFEDGSEALQKEKELLDLYKKFKYTGDALLPSGNTELFYLDILGLDIKI